MAVEKEERTMDMIECAYCGWLVPGKEDDPIPATDDDQAWGNMSMFHRTDCEWIVTRAHRVNKEVA